MALSMKTLRIFVAFISATASLFTIYGAAYAEPVRSDAATDSLVNVNSRSSIGTLSEEKFQSVQKDVDSLQKLDPYTGAGSAVAGAIAGALAAYGGVYDICNSWSKGIQIFLNPANVFRSAGHNDACTENTDNNTGLY